MRLSVTCVLLALAVTASGDEIILKSGRKLVGEIVARTESSVTIEIAPGRVTVPLSAIERTTAGPSCLSVFRERSARLAPDDAAGWLELGIWARDCGLATQAAQAFERAVAIDPANAQAQEALGHVRLGERWVSREESYRAQGLVPFEGDWITPQERDSRLAQREMEARVESQRIEAEARVREAEARARQAEAEAAAAAAAEAAPVVPLWMEGGPSQRHGHRHGHGARARHGHPQPTPSPSPAPRPVKQPKRPPQVPQGAPAAGAHAGMEDHRP